MADIEELIERLRLIAAWHARGGPMPSKPCPNKQKALSEATTALSAQQREIAELREERDSWKQEHENLLSVKEADNAALATARDRWRLLAQRAFAALPHNLAITREIRKALAK